MKATQRYVGIVLISMLLLLNCSKDEQDFNQIELGVWISLDKKDTLDFKTQHDFYKSNGVMVDEHYDYQKINDSLKIGYSGKLFILVPPTKHKYVIEDDKLTIDFTNTPCYGFENQIITYQKE